MPCVRASQHSVLEWMKWQVKIQKRLRKLKPVSCFSVLKRFQLEVMTLASVSQELYGERILKSAFHLRAEVFFSSLFPSDDKQVNLSHHESRAGAFTQIIVLFADGCCLLMSPVPLYCKLKASLICGHNSSDVWRIFDGLFGRKNV